jgi:hypothetical protein
MWAVRSYEKSVCYYKKCCVRIKGIKVWMVYYVLLQLLHDIAFVNVFIRECKIKVTANHRQAPREKIPAHAEAMPHLSKETKQNWRNLVTREIVPVEESNWVGRPRDRNKNALPSRSCAPCSYATLSLAARKNHTFPEGSR